MYYELIINVSILLLTLWATNLFLILLKIGGTPEKCITMNKCCLLTAMMHISEDTLLFEACFEGHKAVLEYLAENVEYLNITNIRNYSIIAAYLQPCCIFQVTPRCLRLALRDIWLWCSTLCITSWTQAFLI